MRIFIASILGILFSCFSPSQRVDDFGNDATKIPDIIILDTQVESETPEIFSLYPKSGYTEGGTEVTISGKNFKEGIDVFFGDVRAELKSFLSNTLIIVITPPNDEGKVDVKVQNPDGRFSILESGFEYKKRDEPIKGCIPKSCEPKPTVFKYDSSKAGFAVSTVELAAQFTNWGDGRIIMNDEGVNGDEISGDGIFTTLVFLKTGEYEYKFILNKNHWISDPDNKEVEPVFKNSVVKVKDGCTPEIINQTPLNGEIIGNKRVRIEVGYFLNGREIDKTGTYFIIDGKRYNAEFSKDKPVVFSEMELAEGAHWYSIVLRDGECNRIVSPSVFFIVKTEKRAPVANAGYTQVVEVGNKVVLDGTLSLDPYQISVDEFKWEVVSAPEPVVLNDEFATDPAGYNNDPNAVPKKVRSLVSFIPRKEGYYRFSLRVSNGDGESNLDETDVYVISKSQSNSKPVIKSEIRLDGTTVIIDASSSLGANSSALSFLWYEDIKNPERFSLSNTPSQRISITKDGTYFFYLIANDKIANSIPKTFFVFKKGNNIVAQDFSHSSKWFESSDVYEIFVRRFADGNGDGIGDLKGLKEKIPYLKELGVETIWLMPVFRSNDRDHGYHTIDYYTVEPDYGDNDDLLSFVSAAHREGMKVVLDMVINHTSRRHPFFIEALNMNPMFRDFYIWFDNPSQNLYDKYGYGREMGGSRLTLETGWAEIPDINYSNPVARQYIYN
ncbi:MAG: alpha-amylase family glycosyl hydrolase, partial [Deltaproteobacteria bacterium]|nr:alpha-amylase family glycosyl hydrolase [Deltaproteobacteria bacterium]